MNPRQIEVFKAVMEAGTVTQAAARLFISQPAASKSLAQFERASGLALFVRDRGRLVPTAEARLLYDEVERVFQGTEQIRQAARDIGNLQRGSLAVGVMPALSVGFVQEIIARIQHGRPDVRLTVQSSPTAKLVEQLILHQFELLYTERSPDHPEIRIEPLCTVPLVCIVPRDHRLAGKRRVTVRDLAGERFAAFRHGASLRRQVDQAFADAKVQCRVVIEAPMAPVLCAYVARGLGVSIVNPLYVGALAPALRIIPFQPRIESTINVAMLRSRKLSVLASAFLQASRELAIELQQRDGDIAFGYGR
jgi:DNA-binding transcriptional LysR family regulator